MNRCAVALLVSSLTYCVPEAAMGRNPRGEEILAFAPSWVRAQDYVWKRVSESRLQNEKNVQLRMEDEGRFRVEFVKVEDDSAVLNVWVLAYNYLTQIGNDQPIRAKSELAGSKLPVVWFHWALGTTMGAAPNLGVKRHDDQQASLVLDLIDFRGFVPVETPAQGAKWNLEIVPDRGEAFQFREELKRGFQVIDASEVDDLTLHQVAFDEVFKVTPKEEGRTWELHEKKGTYWVQLPDGLVDGAEWVTETTESVAGVQGVQKLLTTTTVTVKRMEARERRSSRKRSPVENPSTLPLPPR